MKKKKVEVILQVWCGVRERNLTSCCYCCWFCHQSYYYCHSWISLSCFYLSLLEKGFNFASNVVLPNRIYLSVTQQDFKLSIIAQKINNY
jgi:hypothetical protein